MNGTRRAVLASVGAGVASMAGCAAAPGLGAGPDGGVSVESVQFGASEHGCTDESIQAGTVRLDGGTATVRGTVTMPDTCTPLDYAVFTARRSENHHVVLEIRESETAEPLGPCENCPSERRYEAELRVDGSPSRLTVLHSPPGQRTVMVATTDPPG